MGFSRRAAAVDTDAMNPASAERAVVALCHSGLDVTQLQRQVLAALRRVMTIDAAFFATADPETLLFTGAHSEEPLIAMAPLFLDNELSGRDVNTFPELVRAPGHVRSLDTATRSEWGESRALPRHHAPGRARRRVARRAGRRRPLLGLPVPAPRGRRVRLHRR